MEKKITENEFNDAFKVLKRFLKEEKVYHKIIKYLFPKNRSKKDLFNAINNYDWTSMKEIFNCTETLGPNYRLYGYVHWRENIKNVHEKWRGYYDAYYALKASDAAI